MTRHFRRRAGLVAAALLSVAGTAAAQTPTGGGRATSPNVRPISLDDALRLAESTSEAVRAARAGVDRARGDQMRARSQLLPQVYGSAGYTKTLQSQFEGLSAGGGPAPDPANGPDTTMRSLCAPYFLDANATAAQRQAALAVAQSCRSGGGFDFSNLPFGRENQFNLGLQVTQNLFDGGRSIAQTRIARAGRRGAEIEVAAQRAQTKLEVAQAYYDAALSDRLVAIADSSLSSSERALRHTTLARQVGNTAEFNLLQAQVSRDNLLPVVLQRRTDRDLAYLRLKQLLEIPLTETLSLTTQLLDSAAAPRMRSAVRPVSLGGEPGSPASMDFAAWDTVVAGADTSADARATVRQAAEAVRAQEGLLRVTRAARIPALSLTSQYGRVAYPNTVLPVWNDFLSNWTVGVGLTVPLYTGGRQRGDEVVAQANLAEARARFDQTRELAALDAHSALAEYRQAELSWSASAGTAEQATRAHRIAEVRYAEGISTQLELSHSALLLEQSLANRALAARNLHVARLRLTLLRDLPLSAGGAGAQGARAGAAAQMQTQQTTPQAQTAGGSMTQTGTIGSPVP